MSVMQNVYENCETKELIQVLHKEARSATNGVHLVVYRSLHIDKPTVMVMNAALFFREVMVGGELVPAFRRVSVEEMLDMIKASIQESRVEPATTVHPPKDGELAGVNESYRKTNA